MVQKIIEAGRSLVHAKNFVRSLLDPDGVFVKFNKEPDYFKRTDGAIFLVTSRLQEDPKAMVTLTGGKQESLRVLYEDFQIENFKRAKDRGWVSFRTEKKWRKIAQREAVDMLEAILDNNDDLHHKLFMNTEKYLKRE